jgi:hypothetical protein
MDVEMYSYLECLRQETRTETTCLQEEIEKLWASLLRLADKSSRMSCSGKKLVVLRKFV